MTSEPTVPGSLEELVEQLHQSGHEVNNCLAVIMGQASLLKLNAANEEILTRVGLILESSTQISREVLHMVAGADNYLAANHNSGADE